MNKPQLAHNIAVTLANGAWAADSLSARLIGRLPEPLHRLVPAISADLIKAHRGVYAPTAMTISRTLLDVHAFIRVFRYCERRNIWPDPDLTSPVMSPITAFSRLQLPQLATLDALAHWLILPTDRLDYMADISGRYEEHGETAINHYHYTLLPKKLKGVRVIEAPKQSLKSIQRQILRGILDQMPAHPNAFGFVRGRNCLDAAQRHAGEDVVLNFDLKDFFPSVGRNRIFGLFRCLGYPDPVATCLAALCTNRTPSRILMRLPAANRALYRQAHLPQGAPTSPSLANQVVFALDRRLSALARSLGANYSRYADDLSFSGDRHIAATLLRVVPDIVQGEGLFINRHKTRIMSRGSRQSVTGVVVNRHLNISRDKYDRMKAIIHACGKGDDTRIFDPGFRAKLLGQVEWAEAVNPPRGLKLRKHLYSALRAKGVH